MSLWADHVPTAGVIELPPDVRSLDAIGRNHSLESALADIVDNSLDAGATEVLVRLVTSAGGLRALCVVDNGKGMSPDTIDTAMTLGGRRDYGHEDLGRFGLGLKAASFSQAGCLTVLSKADGTPAVGRRWHQSADRNTFTCDIVDESFADTQVMRDWRISEFAGTGTVVRWDDVHAFPANPDLADEVISRTVSSLQAHLGLMFHRLLADGRAKVMIDVEDGDTGVAGPRTVLQPIDPFAYPVSGRPDWPKDLIADVNGTKVTLRCHIWPGRSTDRRFRLPGGAESWQGLYFYRSGRLLHAGGWEGVHAPDRKLQLARVAIDITGDVAGLFTMNAEKTRVGVGPDFAHTVAAARSADGASIGDYLQAAQDAYTRSQQRTRARAKVMPPGRGIDPKVRREIEEELPLLPEDELQIRWTQFANDDFFDIDRDAGTIWLNQAYRKAVNGGRRGGLNDAPLVKSLLFLLAEQAFHGAHLGPRDKDNLEMWQAILTTAAQVERSNHEERS